MTFNEPYAAPCAMLAMLDRVANRWALLVLVLVQDRHVRFNQLRRELGGVSQKMLSQTVRSLERDGLLHRKVTPTVPVTVEYSITELGLSLLLTFKDFHKWTETRYPEVEEARRTFDQALCEEDALAA